MATLLSGCLWLEKIRATEPGEAADGGVSDQDAGMVPIAKESGAALIIVNAEPTPFDPVADAVLQGSISEILPELVKP